MDRWSRRQVDVGHALKMLTEPIRDFHDLLRHKSLSLLIL
jgi:hypothetical protein